MNITKKIRANLHWLFIFSATLLVWSWIDHGIEKNFDILKPIVEGVIGGCVTALLLLIFSTLWKSNITPWFDNLTYCDTKIEGVWQGVLVPYMGIEEIDRLRMEAAWRVIMDERKEKQTNDGEDTVPVEASIINEKGEKTSTSAELILPSQNESKESPHIKSGEKTKTITITLGAAPIRVRAEFWRVGHKIEGRFVEIGGASEVHTYFIEGTFRNLILCGRYENENPQNIDRGSFSLMLRANGGKFDGFFASYADERHKIHPFRCVLNRTPAGSA